MRRPCQAFHAFARGARRIDQAGAGQCFDEERGRMKRILAGKSPIALLLRQPPIELAPSQCHPVRFGFGITAHDPFDALALFFYPLKTRAIGAGCPVGGVVAADRMLVKGMHQQGIDNHAAQGRSRRIVGSRIGKPDRPRVQSGAGCREYRVATQQIRHGSSQSLKIERPDCQQVGYEL